ncbi:MAG: methionyl-tRNA formyltransferase [Muribaculaceae bacterium]|nr:methionyl-tRNA formyltransferase [Roseburia sp.]MCM1430284.1 methionyl-tRNA formyltransferase [Muribaculaceae bacterium]MCM1492607.1 methionyl-tRNA formyltransferase [Muribaculaceae bacterium]
MRVIFMGTPDFAVGTLEAILAAGHEVALVVTQPDRPKGRGNAVHFSPVKECALAHSLLLYQPKRIREAESVEYLRGFAADIVVVVAFGQILPKSILEMPKYGCVNVHASLLPKYRGAAPIQWAIINGEEITGVTTQRMDEGVDTGDVIAKRELRIAADETGGSLFDKLALLGAKLCVETMEMLEKGTAVFIPQDHEKSTHTSMITKELGDLDWSRPAAALERLVRGLDPWPSAYTYLGSKTFKIWKSEALLTDSGAAPGTVVRADKTGIYVQTGEGQLVLKEVQLEGKKRMDAAAFVNGCHITEGTVLCS